MNACRPVTIKKLIPLFKGEDAANSIELVELEEVGNLIISQKGLYKVGDTAIFIEPDYCIPNNELFKDFYAPYGDPKKSKLGSNGRIKAIKFNLHTGDGLPIYSYGILLPFDLVFHYVTKLGKNISKNGDNYTELLGITKYEIEEGEMPLGIYKTEEENINNIINNISFPITLIGTQKIDGSSISLYSKIDKTSGKRISGICSRTTEIPFKKEVLATKDLEKLSLIDRIFLKIKEKLVGLSKKDTHEYIEINNLDRHIVIGKPYLDKLNKELENSLESLVLRGELCGQGLKGSGNKNNPTAKEDPQIKFYAIDDYSTGVAIRQGEDYFSAAIDVLGFERCKKLFTRTFRNKSELLKLCKDIFEKEKLAGNLMEGIVAKTPDGVFSCKIMNLEYDSKK